MILGGIAWSNTDTVYVSFHNITLTDTLPFAIETILDRTSQDIYGYARDYMRENDAPIVLKPGLSEYLSQSTEGLTQDVGRSYTIRLNRIWMDEVHQHKLSMAVVEMNLSFIDSSGNEVFQSATVQEFSAANPTEAFKYALNSTYLRILREFRDRQMGGKLYERPLAVNLSPREVYMEVDVKALKDGVYENYYDLRDGFPKADTIAGLSKKYRLNNDIRKWVVPKGEDIELPWAYVYKGKVFMRFGEELFPIEKYGNYLQYVEEEVDPMAVPVGMAFGLVGSAIYYGISTSRKGKTELSAGTYRLDAANGRLTPIEVWTRTHTPYSVIVRGSSFIHKQDSVTVSVEGSSCVLKRDEMVLFDLEPSDAWRQVCLLQKEKECMEVSGTFGGYEVLVVAKRSRKKSAEFTKQSEEEKVSIYNEWVRKRTEVTCHQKVR